MIENATPKFKVPIENGTEQKHMFSAWEKCLGEIKNNPEDIRFNLQYDDVGNLKAPNGEVSEYNKYRQKDGAGNFIKPEDENDDPALLLAKVVRSKVFMSGDESINWVGYGNWIEGKDFLEFASNRNTKEPILVFHGTYNNVNPESKLVPSDRSNIIPVIWFSSEFQYSKGFSQDIDAARGKVYVSMLGIREVINNALFFEMENEEFKGYYRERSAGETAGSFYKVTNAKCVFNIPFSFPGL